MRWLRDDKGLTIAELLVVVTLMSLMLGVVYFVMDAVGSMADGSIAHAAAADEAQLFVDRAGRELRQAMEPVEDAGGFSEIGARRCVFYSDITGDAVPERITYYVQNGAMYRTVATCSDTVTPFDSFSAEGAPQKLISEIDADWNGAIFTYYDVSNVAQTNSSKIPTISRVDVEMRAYAKSGQREAVSTKTVTARLRSIQNSLGGS